MLYVGFMLFWLLAAALIVAVAVPLLRALTPKPEASPAIDFDVTFYRSQQAEIERQAESGLMSPEEARLALAEAGRRLLAAKGAGANAPSGGGASRIAKALVILTIPALTLPLYLLNGRPELPAKPYASRPDLNRQDEELLKLIARLDAHLADSPDDARGHELAFPVYMRLGRFDSAASSAERLIALKGETPERWAALAEALIFNARGRVTDDALIAVEKALAADPAPPRARFYKGLAAEQAGRLEEARAVWAALADSLPEGAEKTAVLSHVERIAAPRSQADAAADAIRALPEAERNAAIRGMVEGLDVRLRQGGGSAAEWQRLIRALAVLGEKPRAIAALAEARAALKGQPGAEALNALARELGLGGETGP